MARYSKATAIVVALTLASPVWVAAQDAPKASVLAGFGNALGWIGGQVEGYAAQGRVSGFAGFGYMPELLSDEVDGFVVGALGIRAFTSGNRHRGLLEVSLSALSTSVLSTFGGGEILDKRVNYGSGIAVGYQFIGDGGFTIMLTGGVGLDDQKLDPQGSKLQPTVGIGLGYTWR